MNNVENLSSSLEDYLETIYKLVKENRVARSKDIASELNVTRASVTGALKLLSSKGLINYDPYKYITLTDEGESIARKVARRHSILKDFLVDILSVEPELADASACKMEHAISGVVLDKLMLFAKYIKNIDGKCSKWFDDFKSHSMEKNDQTDQKSDKKTDENTSADRNSNRF